MKIAVASEGKMVTEHFGHCANFNIFDIEDNKVANIESIPIRAGRFFNFLNDLGVKVIISGGIGGAVNIFNEKNIEVIIGVREVQKTQCKVPAGNVGIYGLCLSSLSITMSAVTKNRFIERTALKVQLFRSKEAFVVSG